MQYLEDLLYEPRTLSAAAGTVNPADPYEILVGSDAGDDDEELLAWGDLYADE